jgi:hypothetical protein
MKKLTLAPLSLVLAFTSAHAEVSRSPSDDGEAPPTAPPQGAATPRPTAEEWKSAAPFALARKSRDASSCEATRVREWLRVRCPMPAMGALKTMGANRRGERLRIEERFEQQSWSSSGAEVVLPMRPGDRRVIEWLSLDSGYKGLSGFSTVFVVSEQWIAGEREPIVTVL